MLRSDGIGGRFEKKLEYFRVDNPEFVVVGYASEVDF